jgi:cytochrome P450
MSQHLLAQTGGESKWTIEGLRAIAMNVLGQTGYGQPQHWTVDEAVESKDGKMTYFDAITKIINLLVPAALFPTALMRLGFMPDALRKLGQAMEEYPEHTNELIHKERSLAATGGEERNNFLAMRARLSDQDNKDAATLSLSPEEIRGNLFVVSSSPFLYQ